MKSRPAYRDTFRITDPSYMESIGYQWIPTTNGLYLNMFIGSLWWC